MVLAVDHPVDCALAPASFRPSRPVIALECAMLWGQNAIASVRRKADLAMLPRSWPKTFTDKDVQPLFGAAPKQTFRLGAR